MKVKIGGCYFPRALKPASKGFVLIVADCESSSEVLNLPDSKSKAVPLQA